MALLISLHAYVPDLCDFSFAIGVYLLPASLSLRGGVLLVVAMGICQPTGYLAAGLLGLQALSSALGQRSFPAAAARRLVIGVLAGGGIYYLRTLLSMHGQVANARTGFTSPIRFLRRLTDLRVYQEIYSTSVLLLPPQPQVLLSLTFLVSLLLASFLVVRRSAGDQDLVCLLGLLWLATAMLALLPFLLFYLLDARFPSRVFLPGQSGNRQLPGHRAGDPPPHQSPLAVHCRPGTAAGLLRGAPGRLHVEGVGWHPAAGAT